MRPSSSSILVALSFIHVPQPFPFGTIGQPIFARDAAGVLGFLVGRHRPSASSTGSPGRSSSP